MSDAFEYPNPAAGTPGGDRATWPAVCESCGKEKTGEVGACRCNLAGQPCTRLSHAFDGSVRYVDGSCPKCDAEAAGAFQLQQVCAQLAELRIQRDKLIREHPGTLREIAEATGLTHQGVAYIKAKKP